jgi:hypothetical protein
MDSELKRLNLILEVNYLEAHLTKHNVMFVPSRIPLPDIRNDGPGQKPPRAANEEFLNTRIDYLKALISFHSLPPSFPPFTIVRESAGPASPGSIFFVLMTYFLLMALMMVGKG